MWTPKRILMLSAAFVLLTVVYLLYSATALGRINTLPPLPEQYMANSVPDDVVVRTKTNRKTALERKMEQAFGISCEELQWSVRLEVNSKSMVIAAGSSEPQDDGRVLLKPLSLAIFGKKKNDAGEVEINTLRCQQAYLTFDKPIVALTPNEMNGRKLTKAELYGKITLVNNRRTAARDDDLTVDIPTGPLHYVEKTQFVWTNDRVHLKDGQLIPPKADVEGTALEMQLATAAPPPKPGAALIHKPKNETISGVKRITLKQDVVMHLYVSGSTPFPSGNKPPAKGKPEMPNGAKPAPETSHVIIRTPGRFQYDLFKDHDMARFDVPDDGDRPRSPQDVTVERINERTNTRDQLVCKHLELRIKRREGEPARAGTGAAAQPEQGMEIETAHATGPEVTLTSDAEKLDALGNDFFHDAAQKLTILKGVPFMEANRDGSIIQAPELRIQDVPMPVPPGAPPRTYQQVQATGPGRIDMPNKANDPKKASDPKKTNDKKGTHAFWKDKLLSTRDGDMDLLVLTGDARFVDDEGGGQSLKAETLKVWLLAEEKKPEAVVKVAPAETKPGTVPESSRKPRRIEALRHVVAHSPTLNIPEAGRLIIRFTDVPLSRMPPPSAGSPDKKTPATPPTATRTTALPAAVGPASQAGPDNAARPAGTTAAPTNNAALGAPTPAPNAPPRPIELSARSVEADVLRYGERNALDHLWTEGDVKVKQDPDPAKSDDRGIYIQGDTLDMRCYPEGNMLSVRGDLAHLEMDKILILGPTVNIDQVSNKSWVEGKGAMQMLSTQSLEGRPLGRTVPLKIYWDQGMLFTGAFATFTGEIQAEQENARLACQMLQVQFDKPISLKEGAHGGQPAKVRRLVGDKDVRVEDSAFDKNNQLLKYQLFEGKQITMDSEAREGPRPAGSSSDTNEVILSATPANPGSVRILQRGGADFAAAPPRPGTASPPADNQEMKLTYISFHRRMRASNLTNTADFWESVRVLNMPCNDPHAEIDLDVMLAGELPPGAMYLRCNRLKVLSHPPKVKDGKSSQEMVADGQVYVQAREFQAQSDHMTFDESKDQVIFTADPGNLAVLSKVIAKGAPAQTIRAKRITYIRSTGQWSTEAVDSLSGN